MSYEIHPDPAFWPLFVDRRVAIVFGPPPLFWDFVRDAGPAEIVYEVHGVPGLTTLDGEFPDEYQPQIRLNTVTPPEAQVPFVQMFHGSPGVSQGDDNWDDANPSYQPQLRLNTLPHTEPIVPQEGRWRVNEAFLAP